MMAINEGWKPCFKELLENEKKLVHSSEEAPQLELKLLPSNLKYAYLGSSKSKPRWDDLFIVREVFKHGVVVVEDPRDGRILKHFYLAGNLEDEFLQQGRSAQGSRRHQQEQGQGCLEGGRHGQQQGQGNNLFNGFRAKDLVEVFNVNEDTIRNLQGLQKDKSNIVRVKGRLQVARPPRSREGRGRLERQERKQEREDEKKQRESRRGGRGCGREEREQEERQQEREEEREREMERRESRRGGLGRGHYNGIEETLCTLRLRENIHDSLRADIYNPKAG
ncbi:hypothetical protein SO802_013900 [Lithocarpus litseifolius]|uniref:Uncharacterized protein n=1 Tax=Lithocarpus litseifolius TaxID=425828 RepID=A0AAW2D9P2_9ROSI